MKLVCPWIFLILYLIALARPLAPLLEYQVNRDFFAEVLCINKSKPELKCNGQCALAKKLNQAYKDETKPITAPNSIKLDDYPIGFISLYKSLFKFEGFQSSSFPDAFIEMVAQGHFSEILRPPCAI